MNDLMQCNPFIRYAKKCKLCYSQPENHIAYDCRLFFIISGSAVFTIENEEYRLQSNDALFIPPAHSYQILTSDSPHVHLFIFNFDCECTGNNPPSSLGTVTPDHFVPSLLQKSRLFSPFTQVLFCAGNPEAAAECEQIADLFDKRQDLYREYASVKLKSILLHLDQKQRFFNNKYLRMIYEVKDYIHSHATEIISNESVAQHFGYHSYYLNRLLKQYDHSTITQLIIQYRLENAKTYLTSSQASVAEIATLSGFSNISYFSRIFKEKVGISPNEYRSSFMI